jgi:7,8-dihydropterin-6-yl-methyl-4-(beta-D-ribofuranosyl)aminobenzene 5'-phosphate synthase
MELSVLVDNNTLIDQYFKGEPGLSYYIKEGDTHILFDVGYSGLFIENAQQMGLDLNQVDYLVLSHGHIDHTGGLDPLIKHYFETKTKKDKGYPEIIAHPDCFKDKYYGNNTSIGLNVSLNVINQLFDVNQTKEPLWLTDKLVYLGEIERSNDFEAQKPIGYQKNLEKGFEDYILDDTALAYLSQKGLVIITGCSHAGICNIVEQAKKVTKVHEVVDIIGGLHLMEPEREQLAKTQEYLKRLDLKELHACHCTDLKSKIQLSKVANLKEVGVGMKFTY